jgi:hypothetical protein
MLIQPSPPLARARAPVRVAVQPRRVPLSDVVQLCEVRQALDVDLLARLASSGGASLKDAGEPNR